MMISILISTIDERIEKVKGVLLPQREDVEYIASHQYTHEASKNIPRELRRSDVTVSQIKGKGISRSRNNAMKLAKGQIALLADDDVKYRERYIEVLKQAFQDNPDIPGTLKIIPDLLRHKVSPITYLYHRLSAVVYILRTNKKANHSVLGGSL